MATQASLTDSPKPSLQVSPPLENPGDQSARELLGRTYNQCKLTISAGWEPGQNLSRLSSGLKISEKVFQEFITAKARLFTVLTTEGKPDEESAIDRFQRAENMVFHELKDMDNQRKVINEWLKKQTLIEGADPEASLYKFKSGLDGLLNGLSQIAWMTLEEGKLIMAQIGTRPSYRTPTRPSRIAPLAPELSKKLSC